MKKYKSLATISSLLKHDSILRRRKHSLMRLIYLFFLATCPHRISESSALSRLRCLYSKLIRISTLITTNYCLLISRACWLAFINILTYVTKSTQRLKLFKILKLDTVWYVLIRSSAHTSCVYLYWLSLFNEIPEILLYLYFPLLLITSKLGLVIWLYLCLILNCLQVRLWTQCRIKVDSGLSIVKCFSGIITSRT